jgi:hypothetical protein
MCLGSHGDTAVGDAVREFRQRIARTGSDDEHLQQFFRPASAMVWMTGFPVTVSSLAMKSAARPNLLSVDAEFSDIIGVTS